MNEFKLNNEEYKEKDIAKGIFGNYGWICPKCGRVYSPFTSMCMYCRNENYQTSTTVTKTNWTVNKES